MFESARMARDVDLACGERVARLSPRTWAWIGAVLASTALVYGLAVYGPPFYTKGEPREAVVVAHILDQGEWILPRRGVAELPAKPPLFHWLGALTSAVAGAVTEGTVRTPSLVASLAAIASTAFLGAQLFGPTVGIVAAVALATSQQWIVSSVTARVDMLLAAALTAAMASFLHARARRRRVSAVFWAACALAVLAKGPVGIVLPALAVVVLALVRGDPGVLATVQPGRAAFVLALPLLWYLAAWQRGGEEFAATVLAENFRRMVDANAADVGHHGHPVWFYGPALAAGLAPWSVLLPPAAIELWRRRKELACEPRISLLVWAATTIAFYTLADSKRPVYLLACYPALALLIADWLDRRFAEQGAAGGGPTPAVVRAVQVFAALLAAAAVLVVLQSLTLPVFELAAPALSPSDAANLMPVVRALETRRLPVLLWAGATLAAAWLLVRCARTASWQRAFALVAVLIAITAILVSSVVLRELARSQSVKPFIAAAVAHLPAEQPLYYYAPSRPHAELYFFQSFEYAATFYAGRPLVMVDDFATVADDRRAVWFLTAEPTLRELHDDAVLSASGLAGYSLTEIERYTYGDNPRRTPVVLVEARRG